MPPDPLHHVSDAVEGVLGEVADVAEDVGDVVSRVRADLLGRDGYLLVLVMTIVVVIAIPIDQLFRGGSILTVTALGLLVLTVMTRSKVSPRTAFFAMLIVGISFVMSIVLVVTDDSVEQHRLVPLAATFALSYTVMIALCFPAILRAAFGHRRVTLNTVAASLAAYLMIGLIFTSAFRFVEVVNPPFFTQPDVSPFTYEYFSYITLATVGYGDFTPANDAGRTLAMLEGIFGQVFLVTIVALVVSNLGQERSTFRRTVLPGAAARAGLAPDAGIDPAGDPADDPAADVDEDAGGSDAAGPP